MWFFFYRQQQSAAYIDIVENYIHPRREREREKKSRVDTWQAEVVKTAREKYYNVRPRNNHVSSVYKGEREISQEK